jgi:starch synthase
VLPSVYQSQYGPRTEVPELLGQTLIEAMACGAPVVCTRVASLPEVVEDGVTGIVVPPNDPAALGKALRFLVESPLEAARMGHAGRERVLARFTWRAVVASCLRVYQS